MERKEGSKNNDDDDDDNNDDDDDDSVDSLAFRNKAKEE